MRALIAVALVCCLSLAGAASEPPSKGAREDVQQQNANAKQAEANRAREPRGTASNPVFVKSIPSPESEAETRHKQYEHHEKPTLERLMGWGTGLLAVFTFLLFVFTALLWRATYVMVKEARQSAKQQSIDTLESLRLSKIAADAAKTSADAVMLAERAYVKISHRHPGIETEHTDAGNDINRINFEVKNWGKTPCHVTDVRIGQKLLDYGTPLPKPYPFSEARRESFQNGFLVPGEFLERHYTLPKGDIRTPGKQLWVFGYVDYIDTFGQRWRGGYARKFTDRNDGNLVYNTEEIDNFDRPRVHGEGIDWPPEQAAQQP